MHCQIPIILFYGSDLECCEPTDFNKLFVYALLKLEQGQECISPQLLFIVFVFYLSILIQQFSDIVTVYFIFIVLSFRCFHWTHTLFFAGCGLLIEIIHSFMCWMSYWIAYNLICKYMILSHTSFSSVTGFLLLFIQIQDGSVLFRSEF